MRLSKSEFEAAYANRSKISVERLRAMGRRVYPCRCADELCEGWQSANPLNYWEDRLMRAPLRDRWWIWLVFVFYRARGKR